MGDLIRTSLLFTLITLATALLSCSEKTPPPAPTPVQPAKPVIGKAAPDFSLQDTTGKVWRLSELKGNLVFLNFWATWCPPCLEELPSMDALNKRLKGEKFTMLTVIYNDDPKRAEDYVKAKGYNVPILIDPDGRYGATYGLTGVPETFIIDKDGILREWIIGPALWTSPVAINKIGGYLPPKG